MPGSIGGASYSREHPLPDGVRALRGVEGAVLQPLLEAVVVGDLGAVERGLEVGQRVGRAEEVLARAVLDDRVDRLAVLGHVDALDEDRRHPALVGVEDELLVADRQPALEPAGRVEDEVDAGEDRRAERGRRLVGGLGVGDLRGAEVAAGPERHAESPGERPPSRTARARAPGSRTSARRTASTSS